MRPWIQDGTLGTLHPESLLLLPKRPEHLLTNLCGEDSWG